MIRIPKSVLLVWAVVPAMLACQPTPTTPPKLQPVAKVKSFGASPASLNAGETATLSWEVENATSVSIRTPDGQSLALPDPTQQVGTFQVKVERTSVYVLSAAGEGGNDASVTSVVVAGSTDEEAPLLFAAYPDYLRAGEKTTLVWNAPDATLVELRDSADQVVPTSGKNHGSVELTPTATTTYTLRADGVEKGGVKVTVAPGPVTFQSDVTEANPGATVNLSWHVIGADSVTLSVDGRGVLLTTSDPARVSDGSFADTVPETLPANGILEYTLETRIGGNPVFTHLTVYVGADPVIVAFTVPEYVRPGVSFPVSWKTAVADRVEIAVDGNVIYRAPTSDLVHEGTMSLAGIQAQSTVELRATSARGGLSSKSVTVEPVGTPTLGSFTASPQQISQGGQKVTLSWNVPNARHVKIAIPGESVITEARGASVGTGSVDVYPNKPTVYVLDADNDAGDAIPSEPKAVNVTAPAKLTFSLNGVPYTRPLPANTPIAITGSTAVGGGDLYTMDFPVKNAATGLGYVDISETGHLLPFRSGDDSGAYPVTLPEPIQTQWAGVPAGSRTMYVNINGYVTFSDTAPTGNFALPGTVMPMNYDFVADATTRVLWQLDGTGDQRRLIVQWTDVRVSDSNHPLPYPPAEYSSFQAQLYATGEIVFAYAKIAPTLVVKPTIAVVAPMPLVTVSVPAAQLSGGANKLVPLVTDTFRFFGKLPLPYAVTASATKLNLRVDMGNGQRMTVQDGPALVLPGQIGVSEANYNPVAGKSQWIEIQNNTSTDFDLDGWYLDFGGATKRTTLTAAPGNKTVVPANGRLLLGATAGPDLTFDYVYGTTYSIATSFGTVGLGVPITNVTGVTGVTLDTLSMGSSATPGTSMQVEYPSQKLLIATGVPGLTCLATAVYPPVTGTQKGTPGAPNTRCFPWDVTSVPPSFEPIALTGTPVSQATPAVTLVSTGDSSFDLQLVSLILPKSVKIAGNTTTWGTSASPIRVDSNGFIALGSNYSQPTQFPYPVPSIPATNWPNNGPSAPKGVLAPFWADLAGNALTNGPSGVYWKQYDANGTWGDADDYTLISWENWKNNGTATSAVQSSLNFQIKIFQATGFVEFQYGNMTASTATYSNGSDATVWMATFDAKGAIPVSVKQPQIQSNMGYRFTYTP